MEIIVANLARSWRRVYRNGREFLVGPVTLIVPGVLAGSRGALLYPHEEIAANVDAWNGMPIVVYHPTKGGQNVSARDPDVLERQGIGAIYHTTFTSDRSPPGQDRPNFRLVSEAWVDVKDAERVDERVVTMLDSGAPIEVSTGLFTENIPGEGQYNGKPYTHIARNYKPDHLAILPDQVGACSVKEGCGINVPTIMANRRHVQALVLNSARLGRLRNAMVPQTVRNCGGVGGDPGPCPGGGFGGSHSDTAADATRKAAQATSGLGGKFGRHAEDAGVHADEAVMQHGEGNMKEAMRAHARAVASHTQAAHAHTLAGRSQKTGGRASAHAAAAQAHYAAADAHGKAYDAIDKAGRGQANNSRRPMDRTQKIQWLTTNCECWKGPGNEQVLNALTDEQLNNMVTNARTMDALVNDLGITVNADDMPDFVKKKADDDKAYNRGRRTRNRGRRTRNETDVEPGGKPDPAQEEVQDATDPEAPPIDDDKKKLMGLVGENDEDFLKAAHNLSRSLNKVLASRSSRNARNARDSAGHGWNDSAEQRAAAARMTEDDDWTGEDNSRGGGELNARDSAGHGWNDSAEQRAAAARMTEDDDWTGEDNSRGRGMSRNSLRGMSEQEYLRNAPPRIRNILIANLRAEQRTKQQLIERLVANAGGERVRNRAARIYSTMSVPQLHAIADTLPLPDDGLGGGYPNYLGAAGAITGNAAYDMHGNEGGDDILPLPTTNRDFWTKGVV